MVSSWMTPVPPPSSPSFHSSLDTSVVVATIDGGDTLAIALSTWLEAAPLEIIIVTIHDNLALIKEKVASILKSVGVNTTTVVVLSIPKASKRRQMARGIEQARGCIILLTDDDVFWPREILPLVLACFEDPRVGGVGTTQKGDFSLETVPSVWAFLADRRLQRRNVRCAMTNYCDDSVTCLSGRTAAYRAHIIKDSLFLHEFTNDLWLGKFLLDSGDDTFLTRWLLSAGWAIKMQVDPRAEITTPALQSHLFLKQLLRWSRNSKRSCLRCIFLLPSLWRSNPFLLPIMIDGLLRPFVSVLEVLLLIDATSKWNSMPRGHFYVYLVTKILYLYQEISSFVLPLKYFMAAYALDMISVPLDFYAFLTLHVTTWGSRNVRKRK